MRKSPLICFMLFALLSGAEAWAQDSGDERWYKVELLVFSHETSPAGNEQWEATPALEYPTEFRFLVEPERVKANEREHSGGQSLVDDFGRQIITLPGGSAHGSDYYYKPSRQPEEIEALQNLPDTDSAVAGASPAPTPFIALPPTEHEFRGKAAYMQRSGRYQTLFHEAWYQPIAEESASLPLVLDRSGDGGQWPRLQGSVKFHLSRYLHIETNLWLNTQGDYLPGDWVMPAPPLGPPSLIIEDPLADVMEPGYVPGDSADTDSYTGTGTVNLIDSSGNPIVIDDRIAEGHGELLEPQGPLYPYRHAVLLQQQRRMRSTEIHYIDHPLLGVVVSITPLTEEQLEDLARAEAGMEPTSPAATSIN